jgi:hypothetical protein
MNVCMEGEAQGPHLKDEVLEITGLIGGCWDNAFVYNLVVIILITLACNENLLRSNIPLTSVPYSLQALPLPDPHTLIHTHCLTRAITPSLPSTTTPYQILHQVKNFHLQ